MLLVLLVPLVLLVLVLPVLVLLLLLLRRLAMRMPALSVCRRSAHAAASSRCLWCHGTRYVRHTQGW